MFHYLTPPLLHEKNTLFAWSSFWDIKILTILQSDWSRAFLFITWERDFSKICSFCRIIKSTMADHINPKISHQWNKFLANSKKHYFWWYFRIFPQNNIFSWLQHFFILNTPKLQRQFYKNPIRYFWLTDWLTDSLTDWMTDWLAVVLS